MNIYDNGRHPWQTPTPGQVDAFIRLVRRVATSLLPEPGAPWTAGRRQEALDLAADLSSDFPWDHDDDHVVPLLVRLPSPYDLARAVAAEQSSTWPDEADALLFAHLNRSTMSEDTYDHLTGPWRVLVGPLHPIDRDPEMDDGARVIGMLLLRAGGEYPTMSVADQMAAAIGVAAPFPDLGTGAWLPN